MPNALELIGRGHSPPCPRSILSIQHSLQSRPASPVRSSEMLGGICDHSKMLLDLEIVGVFVRDELPVGGLQVSLFLVGKLRQCSSRVLFESVLDARKHF